MCLAGVRYFFLAWSLLLVGVAVPGLGNLGWLPTNFFTSLTRQIGSGPEMPLSFALADRINSLRRDKERGRNRFSFHAETPAVLS